MICNENFCSALCQHPTCWQSQRRITRGTPHSYTRPPSPESEDEGLPTQKVVNLLDEYGFDKQDRYPSKYGGRATHTRSMSVSALDKRRDSFPKTRAPNATPASQVRSAGIMSATHRPPPKTNVGKVEVQEVFDLDDLHNEWHETFLSKKYYVWVPNPSREPKVQPMTDVPISQMSAQAPAALGVKDLTEEMVPREVEWERERTRVHQPKLHRNIRHFRNPKKARGNDRRSPISFYSMSPISSAKLSRQGYHGLHELLDLPRDVLSKLVSHIDESEMLDRERFAGALLRTLPKLQKENTTVSLAYGNVLQQRPVRLQEGRKDRNQHLEPIPARQVFLMDDTEVLEKLSTANDPSTHKFSYMAPDTQRSLQSRAEPEETPLTSRTERTLIPFREPLPGIPPGKKDEELALKKIPRISLGLPSIPSGLQVTRTFTYPKDAEIDFALGVVQTPAQSEKRSSSPTSTERSSIVVNMPKVTNLPPSRTPSGTELDQYLALIGQTSKSPTRGGAADASESGVGPTIVDPSAYLGAPSHGPSSFSRDTTDESFIGTHFPRPPPTTPNAVFGVSHYTPDQGAQHALEVIRESLGGNLSFYAQNLWGFSSHLRCPVKGILRTIPETDDGEVRQEGNPPPSRGGRSVHFAPDDLDMPPQPPSTPRNEADSHTASPPATPSMVVGTSLTVHYSDHTPSEYDGLMVVGKGAGNQTNEDEREESPDQPKAPASSPSCSPEPWPQVDEDAYRMLSPTPPPHPSRGNTEPELAGTPVNLDGRSDKPPSLPKTPGGNGSSPQSEKLRKIWGGGGQMETESPGPPPPSPEARDNADPMAANSFVNCEANSGLGPLDMVLETSESELTISAKPPSNLDDISRINTPATYASQSAFASREPTMDALAEVPSGENLVTPAAVPEEEDGENTRQALDQFDATPEQFNAELQQEYEKLSEEQENKTD